jgi:CRP-like cAMP-binding protein
MSNEDNIELLSRLPVFSKLEPSAVRLIAIAAETRHLRAGDILFRQGDLADCGYLLVSGALALDGIIDNGTVARGANIGDFLGETALIVATKRHVTAVARQNTTVLRVSRALFLRVLEEYPASAERLLRDVLVVINSVSKDLEAFRRGLIAGDGAV